MKAFIVTNEAGIEGPTSVIVFAESASKAKSRVHHGDGFDCDWTDITVKRAPSMDDMAAAEGEGVLWWQSERAQRIYRKMGWQMFEADTCDQCGMFESGQIPESALEQTEDGNICKECRNQNEK